MQILNTNILHPYCFHKEGKKIELPANGSTEISFLPSRLARRCSLYWLVNHLIWHNQVFLT